MKAPMNPYKLLIIILLFSFFSPGIVSAGSIGFIPLNNGNWWQYRVAHTFSEYDDAQDKEVKRTETYKIKIEVLKVAKYENITAALFSGIPGGILNEPATLLVFNNADYYWANAEVFDLVAAKNGRITIAELQAEAESNKIKKQELSLPLNLNKLFACDERRQSRQDKYYCQWVRSIKPAKQEYFPGKNTYEIAAHTLPDETHSHYVSGAGLTYFSYSHHGKLDEERWVLQRYYLSTK